MKTKTPRKPQEVPDPVPEPFPPVDPDALLTWLEPAEEDGDLSSHTVWWTACKRYRVVRRVSRLLGGENHFVAGHGMRELVGSYYCNLRDAVEACERHHTRKTKRESVESNKGTIIVQAEHNGIDHLPRTDRVEEERPQPGYDRWGCKIDALAVELVETEAGWRLVK